VSEEETDTVRELLSGYRKGTYFHTLRLVENVKKIIAIIVFLTSFRFAFSRSVETSMNSDCRDIHDSRHP
jgi:hypothetical protein